MNASILVIDDEPDAFDLFRQRYRREIRQGKYVLHFASSGEDALEFLNGGENHDTSVVLSDIRMPGIDGIELLEQVKQAWPDVPVFMVSAFADAKTRDLVLSKGADGFYSKPKDFASLDTMLTTRFVEADE